jgi:hypothetical protein
LIFLAKIAYMLAGAYVRVLLNTELGEVGLAFMAYWKSPKQGSIATRSGDALRADGSMQ